MQIHIHITSKQTDRRKCLNAFFFVLMHSKHIFPHTLKFGWGIKFGMIKFRTTNIPELQNYEY